MTLISLDNIAICRQNITSLRSTSSKKVRQICCMQCVAVLREERCDQIESHLLEHVYFSEISVYATVDAWKNES